MNRNELAAVVAAIVGAVTAIVAPIAIVSANSTERLHACVDNGGSYVRVPETTAMECRR